MSEQTKKEREVYAIGRPSLEHLSPNERKAFFSTLLMSVIGHFKEDTEKQRKRIVRLAALYKFDFLPNK